MIMVKRVAMLALLLGLGSIAQAQGDPMLVMIPITLRSTENFLRLVPRSLHEAAMALGASKWKTIATVVIPAAYRGVLTAILLSLARVAGESAPLLFTACSNRFWSPGWGQPPASLPVMIFTYAIAPYE